MNIRHATTKIYIVGGPGSGKTTLAARLAEITGLPCYELDSIAYAEFGPRIPQRPDHELAAEVAQIQALEGWVVEGMYFGWSDP